MADEEVPKIIVDSDWKAEARKEKEKLEEEIHESAGGPPGEIPPPSLLELVEMIVMQASIGLQGFQDPNTGRMIPPNLGLARHYIDLLQLLSDKTSDRLDEQEKAVMSATLHELRMAFVQIAQAATGAAQAAKNSKTPLA